MPLTVEKLIKDAGITVVSGEKGLSNKITKSMLNRPGLELSGYFDNYPHKRLQIIGTKEIQYFYAMSEELKCERVKKIFKKTPPAIIFTDAVEIPKEFVKHSNEYNVPVLVTEKTATSTFGHLYNYIGSKLAKRQSIHGVLLNVRGVGVLIKGESGIGKSEVALELIKEGNQLISDDRIDVYEKEVGTVIGESPEITKGYMEIRGIGIVDVIKMYGAGAYRSKNQVHLIVELVDFATNKNFDRLGLSEEKEQIFNTNINYVKLPVNAGRSISSLIEVACLHFRLRLLGENPAQDFVNKMENSLKGE